MILILILAVSCQLTWLPKLAILTVAPDLILSGVLAFAVSQKEEENHWWIVIPVLIWDLLIGRPFGLLSLSLCLMFFSVELLAELLFKKNDLPAILLLLVIGVLFFEFYHFLLAELFSFWRLANPMELTVFYFSTALPIKIFYNGLLAWLGTAVIKRIKPLFYYG